MSTTTTKPTQIEAATVAGYFNADIEAAYPQNSDRGLLKLFSKNGTVVSFAPNNTDCRDVALINSRRSESSEYLTNVLGRRLLRC